ncbi:MAG: hypothetical protein HY741_03070 [Chloroflexi bacterium]|nr:hypothetical protein [Chloroflexota bacterium]
MTLTVELTLDQIADAIRRLTPDERVMLFRLITNQPPSEQLVPKRAVPQVTEQKSDYVTARAELDRELAIAAEALLPDYLNDKELTAFTALDAEDFYAEK